MKALITILVVLWATTAIAAPHLTADPQTGVVAYECTYTGNPTPTITTPQDNGDGTVSLMQDMAGLVAGAYTVTCVADGGLWGKSGPSLPFSFVKPDLSAPGLLRFE